MDSRIGKFIHCCTVHPGSARVDQAYLAFHSYFCNVIVIISGRNIYNTSSCHLSKEIKFCYEELSGPGKVNSYTGFPCEGYFLLFLDVF